jgi:hypothetical protein
MSDTDLKLGNTSAPISFANLLLALSALSAEFYRKEEGLALKNGGVLTAELKAAVVEHKLALLTLTDLRSELYRLHDYLIRLRCEDPPKGTRKQALSYQAAQIEKLTARCIAFGGTADGWTDPGDDFADSDQIKSLRQALAEVESGPYPLPLPPGCKLLPEANFDPFEHDRLYNGARSALCEVL